MPLGVLNNISAIYAENNLNQTQSSLQNTLTQLSSGSRINSGADDAAGLSIANGLQANSSALTQSSSNATAGVGYLQVADGALSQVTNLLNRAVTLATEAGGGTLSTQQMSAANQEYQDILSQINTIGSTTEYNGIQVFGSDTSLANLTWAQGAGTAASSATTTGAAMVAASAITAGGSSAVANGAVQAGVYNTAGATAMVWTPQSTNGTGNNVLLSGPILANQSLTGTLTFTPTGGSNPVSVTLSSALGNGNNMTTLASNLQTALNTAAGAADYTVSVVNPSGTGNELAIGLSATGTGAGLTGFVTPASAGSVASQTGYTLTAAANGDALSGTLSFTAQSTTAAGTAANVVIGNSGSSNVGLAITAGNTLSGSISVGASISASTVSQALNWTQNGSGATQTESAQVNLANTLSGSFTVTGTGDGNAPYTINLNDFAGMTTSAAITTKLQSDISTIHAGSGANYSATYANGVLTIGLSTAGQSLYTGMTVANGGTAATEAIPTGTVSPVTVNLTGVSTDNIAKTVMDQLGADPVLGSDYKVTYSAGNLSIQLATGLTGTVSVTSSGGTQLTQATPASVTNASSATTVTLAGTNTANLATAVGQALNGVKNGTSAADYSVAYSSSTGALTVSLTSQAATDGITGITWGSGAISQTTASATASIAVNDYDTVGGQFTIGQNIAGVAQTAVTVPLNGTAVAGVGGGGSSTEFGGTSPAGQSLIDAVNTALGNNARYYNVGYSVNSSTGIGTLSIAVNATGIAANVDSVSITNGSGNNALFQTETANSTIDVGSNVLGNMTLTPAGSSTTPIDIDLSTTSTADLVSALQTQLGADYLVGYNTAPSTGSGSSSSASSTPVPGTLSIGVSEAGIAAGITGFTLSEATTQGASVLSAPNGGVEIYTSDGTSTGSKNYNVTVGTLSDASVGTSDLSSALGTQITATVGGVTGTGGYAAGGSAGSSLTGTALTSQADAEAALQTVDNAISAVAYQRGQVGANINTLTAASNIAAAEETNVQSAQNNITQTDYASATSNMSKYEILTQTGISALAQANSTQQMVLKLLQ